MTLAETPLEPFAEDIWVKRIPLRFVGLQMGSRMTVIRLGGDGLFVHSPTEATAETRAAVDALGPIRFVVAPNRLHHLFAGGWFTAYPDARIHCVRDLVRKRSDLPWHGVLGDEPEPGWAADVDQCLFRGSVFQDEAIFLHKRSRTLIVTDLLESAWPEDARPYRWAARLLGTWRRAALTRDQRLLVWRRQSARRTVRRILDWDFERIILAHGRLVETDGKAVFAAAMRWLGV